MARAGMRRALAGRVAESAGEINGPALLCGAAPRVRLGPMRYLILPLLLAACAPVAQPPDPRPAPADPGACGAEARQSLIGAPATALERELILGQVRILRPGDLATMDFVPERINFEIDAMERITRIYCG